MLTGVGTVAECAKNNLIAQGCLDSSRCRGDIMNLTTGGREGGRGGRGGREGGEGGREGGEGEGGREGGEGEGGRGK